MLPKKLILLFLLLQCINASSQKKDLPDSLRQLVLAVRYHSGFIFAHSIHVQNTKGVNPDGFELEYSHLYTDAATRAKFKCYPRTGFSLTYVDFNKDLLGKSYSLSYFLEPDYRVGNNLKLLLRLSGGLSYLTNPYDSIKNPYNQSYSGHINSFLQLGFGASYPVSKHFSIYAMANFFHNSNGGFKEPNAGVNYVNASIGVQYYQHSTRFPVYHDIKDTSWKHKPLHMDVSLFYSPKDGYNGNDTNYTPTRKLLLGTSFQVSKQVSSINALTAGAEVYYDGALRSIKEIFIYDSASSNTLVGITIGNQFLLNRFVFTQEIGVYVYKQTKLYNDIYQDLFHDIYHRWGLYYNITNHWSVGINLLAHKQVADFIDGRVIYRIK